MKKPSVTELIGLLDKPALMNWANKIGLEGIKLEDYRKKVMSSGTSMHKQIEDYFISGTEFENELFFEKFMDFMSDKKMIDVEKKIETHYFTGRYDIKLIINHEVYICDFKSNHKSIYLENKLQLASYKMAEQCDRLAIISIPDFKLMILDIRDYTPYQDIMINLSNIYKLKQQIA